MKEGFREEYFEQLAGIEARHFWFRSRNRLIIWALGRYFPDARSFLEIGCGTGFVLAGIERAFPEWRLRGGEFYPAGLQSASRRVKRAELLQMDARDIPFSDEIDVVGAFDVLEHILEDEMVLSQLYQALHRGGGAILTVPQHSFLWSSWDTISCHQRRYSQKELVVKMERAGFRIVRITSFFALLLPLLILSRLGSRSGTDATGIGKEPDLDAEFGLPRFLNSSFEKVCTIERAMLKCGFSFPAGGSLLCVAMKD